MLNGQAGDNVGNWSGCYIQPLPPTYNPNEAYHAWYGPHVWPKQDEYCKCKSHCPCCGKPYAPMQVTYTVGGNG